MESANEFHYCRIQLSEPLKLYLKSQVKIMLFQILLFASGSILLISLSLVAHSAFVCRWARWKYQKATRGLPMLPDLRSLGNGSLSWALRKNLNSELVRVHKEIGKTIGQMFYTSRAVFTVDLDLIKRIHRKENNNINRMGAINLPLSEFEKSIMLAQGDQWRRVRRSFAPAFKSNSFKTTNVRLEIERSIEKLVRLIDEKLADESKRLEGGARRVELDDLAHRYTLNLSFSCLFKQPDLINFDERPSRWVNMIDEGLREVQANPFVHACMLFPVLTPLIDWIIYNLHPKGVWRRELMGFVKRQTRLGFEARREANQLIAEGKQMDPNNFIMSDGTKFSRNMIDYVIDRFLDGRLSKEEYFNNSCFMLMASDKTTVDCIIHTLYQIALNSDIQKRLRKSIQNNGAQSEYLSWVFNESLRLMPPVGSGCGLTLEQDTEIEGGRYVLPRGTYVSTPSYAIHRLPEYWGDDAEEFKPERWQDTTKHHQFQYMPFGIGPRSCPGKEFALFEMKELFVSLLTRYEFQAEPKADLNVFDAPLLVFLIPNSPTYVTIKHLDSYSQS